ncbi:MBOAT family O-acyltransferase [Roseofilum capinflatum]|uniref:MBOAT family protein n=1 Tax=Roseofilum capinflatum BLCC-M114 TaxID=3022440 RepID=A0ABT7B2V4_9CYAN|nr:MBOAT family protein [Roseofilum capinflatum]MDJ1172896.1 MBOAT family protein [Roseofilum capinflatum BLCC-M114]
MLFNSYIFIFLFLPLTLTVWIGLNRFKLIQASRVWLTVASLVFYGYWNIAYLPLLLLSVGFNYQMGKAIAQSQPQTKSAKTLLWIGIGVNLVLIGYYKYAHFLVNSVNSILPTHLSIPDIILPLAISFYTFTQIAYLVDAYRGETQALNYDPLTYGLFVIFFPQLIAGPILRHNQLIPQFRALKTYIFCYENFTQGCVLFSLGLCKKVLIADRLSLWVAPVFDHASEVTFLEAWVGVLSYTYQLYFDFSGYSDMAIALGLLFNIHLPINFNSPYKATSIRDFWQRWHITLSHFLRDYLYIPLGGNRKGEIRHYTHLIITMLLGGLWHGAGWTYVIWGGLHGVYLCINHLWRKLNLILPQLLSWAIAFLSVMIAWVIFRAKTLPDSLTLLQTMSGVNGIILPTNSLDNIPFLTPFNITFQSWYSFNYLPEFWQSQSLPFLILFCLTLAVKYCPNTQELMAKFKLNAYWATGVGLLTAIALLSLNRVSEFLYFQF